MYQSHKYTLKTITYIVHLCNNYDKCIITTAQLCIRNKQQQIWNLHNKYKWCTV